MGGKGLEQEGYVGISISCGVASSLSPFLGKEIIFKFDTSCGSRSKSSADIIGRNTEEETDLNR